MNKLQINENLQVWFLPSFLIYLQSQFSFICGFTHSFGKHMVSKNINLSTIKALMGHENIQTTLIYARSDEESMIRAVVQKGGH